MSLTIRYGECVRECLPLECPRRKESLRVIALIDDASVLQHILEYYGLLRTAALADCGPLVKKSIMPHNPYKASRVNREKKSRTKK